MKLKGILNQTTTIRIHNTDSRTGNRKMTMNGQDHVIFQNRTTKQPRNNEKLSKYLQKSNPSRWNKLTIHPLLANPWFSLLSTRRTRPAKARSRSHASLTVNGWNQTVPGQWNKLPISSIRSTALKCALPRNKTRTNSAWSPTSTGSHSRKLLSTTNPTKAGLLRLWITRESMISDGTRNKRNSRFSRWKLTSGRWPLSTSLLNPHWTASSLKSLKCWKTRCLQANTKEWPFDFISFHLIVFVLRCFIGFIWIINIYFISEQLFFTCFPTPNMTIPNIVLMRPSPRDRATELSHMCPRS